MDAVIDIGTNSVRLMLAEFDGNVTKAAKAVGLSRATMYRKIAEYNL